jgi:putative SOS response-associated peptidase YedK
VFGIRVQPNGDKAEALKLRWGLVPIWSKSLTGPALFNARAETVAEKPSFRTAFNRRRCLISADGFYEWHVVSPEAAALHHAPLGLAVCVRRSLRVVASTERPAS